MSTCVGTCGHYIIITMVTGECQWSDLPLIKEMMTGCRSLPSHEVRLHHHPNIQIWYLNGQIGMVLASLNRVRLCE